VRALVPKGRVPVRLLGLCMCFTLLAAASCFVYLAQSSRLTTFWKGAVLTDIRPEAGFAFIARTKHPELSSHEKPSQARLLENGVPLSGGGNRLHDDIRKLGKGGYLFWHDYVYFAPSDNTDPRTNGKRYEIFYPLIVNRLFAHAIYALTALVAGCAVFSAVFWMRERRKGAEFLLTSGVLWILVFLSSLTMIVTALTRTGIQLSLMHVTLCFITVLLNVLAAWALRNKFGSHCSLRSLLPFLLALMAAYYLLVAVAPHAPQGCRTEVAYSAWDAFCTSPDSASYYFGYQAGSSRQPLYSLFIRLVTTGTNFDPLVWAQQHPVAVAISDPHDPLHRVERAQIVLLLGGGLAACATMMALLNSPLPAVLFFLLYDFFLFTAWELNQILTESLVQAWLFLLIATFLAFLWKRQKMLLPLAALLCGLLYLTRQAAGYTSIFLAAMILWGMFSNWKMYWRPSFVSICLLGGLMVIPDVYGCYKLGKLSAAQESLQYQYRIAYALQVAQPQDVVVMPDGESRAWLLDALKRREVGHLEVDKLCKGDKYCQQVYYINYNLYFVATPPGFSHPNLPEFFMKISTPILKRHWLDYLVFGFRSWALGLTQPRVARIRMLGFSPWWIYAACFGAALVLRGRVAFAAATLICAHFSHVALTALFAAPIPRMVWASEFLVVIAAFLLLWDAAEKINNRLMQSLSVGGL
jgi:hypothetical protein